MARIYESESKAKYHSLDDEETAEIVQPCSPGKSSLTGSDYLLQSCTLIVDGMTCSACQ